MKDAVETSTLLALPDEATVANAFASAETLTSLLEVIAKECRAEVLTAATAEGRDRIKSLAYKIARSKTTIDKIGKGLTEEARKLQAEINARRGIAEKFLDALKDEMRQPLTKWEEAEDARKQAHKDRMGAFSPTALPVSSAALSALAMQIEAVAIDDSWEEFTTEAATAKANCLRHLGMKIADAMLEEEREAELQRLRAAEAERKAEADAAQAAKDAEIEALRAQLAAANAPKPEPTYVGMDFGHEDATSVTTQTEIIGTTATVVVVDELAAAEAAIRAAVLSIIAECNTADATAAEVASAIMLGEIPHVKVVL